MNDKTTVLVLGSTEMLGTKIVKALLEKGEAEVRAMIRPGSYDKHQEDIDAMSFLVNLGNCISNYQFYFHKTQTIFTNPTL